jgi:hypothetical protein
MYPPVNSMVFRSLGKSSDDSPAVAGRVCAEAQRQMAPVKTAANPNVHERTFFLPFE